MLASSADNQPANSASRPIMPDRLIPIREVQEQCGLSKSAIYDAIKTRAFPPPAKVGKSSRWLQSEIQRFIAERAAARLQP